MKKKIPLWYKNHSHLERHTDRHDPGFVNCGQRDFPVKAPPARRSHLQLQDLPASDVQGLHIPRPAPQHSKARILPKADQAAATQPTPNSGDSFAGVVEGERTGWAKAQPLCSPVQSRWAAGLGHPAPGSTASARCWAQRAGVPCLPGEENRGQVPLQAGLTWGVGSRKCWTRRMEGQRESANELGPRFLK